MIYYSNGYDLEKRIQSEDRAHRIGQKKSVTYVDILAEETVDEKIVKSLRKKINIASKVMGEELRNPGFSRTLRARRSKFYNPLFYFVILNYLPNREQSAFMKLDIFKNLVF